MDLVVSPQFFLNTMALCVAGMLVAFSVNRYMYLHQNEAVRYFRTLAVASIDTLVASFGVTVSLVFFGVPGEAILCVIITALFVAAWSWWFSWADPRAPLERKIRSAWIQTIGLDIVIGSGFALIAIGEAMGHIR